MRKTFAVALLLALATIAVVPSGAGAAARVTITNEFGKAEADPTYMTRLTLRGSGFQAIKNGHGGIYVFFGTVRGTWRPSQGGITGKHYLYVPDTESKNNKGYQRFIAFQGSDTASAAHGVVRADGSWSTTINVPGATFKAVDRDGKALTVDCRKVACGVITIGAHGVKNANNESFTPVTFRSLYDRDPAGTQPTTPSTPGNGNDGGNGNGGGGGTGTKTTRPSGPATAAVDLDTAVVGRVLTFTGTGFTPGEQVTVSFDNGKAAVGPLPAGTSGEVGGVIQLPADIRPGTHSLRLTGAASGRLADINFPVAADTTAVPEPASSGLPGWAAWVFLAVALLLLAAAGVFAVRRFRVIHAESGKEPLRAS